MKIGVDIDDVLAEFVVSYLGFYNQKYKKNLKREDIFSYNLWIPLNISKEEAVNVTYELFNSKEYDKIGVVEGSREGVKKLSLDNELIAITARPTIAKEKTERFLKDNYPSIFDIHYTGDFFNGALRKSEVCSKLGIDLMI